MNLPLLPLVFFFLQLGKMQTRRWRAQGGEWAWQAKDCSIGYLHPESLHACSDEKSPSVGPQLGQLSFMFTGGAC
jgi:hypothetical protein